MPYNASTNLQLSTGPTIEPVSVDDVREHLYIDHNDDDAQLEAFITAARLWAEGYTGRQFNTATYVWNFDEWPDDTIVLPKPPLQSVTSVKYYDTSNTQQTLGTTLYDVATNTPHGEIRLGYQDTWPTLRGHRDDIEVTFVAGYGDDAADVPQTIRNAIMMLVGTMYENREETTTAQVRVVPMGARALLDIERIWEVV